MVNFVGPAPKITIGGIPVNEQEFTWALKAGIDPYFGDFVVRKGELSNSIAALNNPTYIEMDVWGGISGQPKNHKLKFENIYLLQPKPVDDYFVQWSIADVRWSWRGMKVKKSWNKTRIQNQFGTANTSPDTDPAVLRKPFDTFATGRYIPWSVKDDGKPYTVYEMMIEIFDDLGISHVKDPKGADRSYVEENIQFDAVDIYQALASLCAKARHSIYIGEDGKARAFSLDFFDENPQKSIQASQATAKVSPGSLYRQDLSRIRPKKITVRFEKKQEVRIIATPANLENINNPIPQKSIITTTRLAESGLSNSDFENRRTIGCINVLPVPLPIQLTNRSYNIGEYAAFDDYLNALGITDAEIRRYYLVPDGITYLIQSKISGLFTVTEADITSRKIASAIKQNYRLTYMIDPFFIDQIESWEARRCSVIDNYSAFSPPSPVWMNYCLIPNARPPRTAQKKDLYNTTAVNYYPNQYDPNRQKADTFATINVVSQPLGVFRISTPSDVDGVIEGSIPSSVDPLPQFSPSGNNIFWSGCSLEESHVFETLISVVWATDKDQDFSGTEKYYSVPIDYGSKFGIAKGPDIEFLSRKEYARFSTPSADVQSGTFVQNEDTISAIAKSEAARIIHQFQNRIVGTVTLAGFQRIEIAGNIKTVGYSFSRAKGAVTMLDLRDIPPTPSLEQNLDDETIASLHRQVPRSDEKNNIGVGA